MEILSFVRSGKKPKQPDMLLCKSQILELIENGTLVISPLLDTGQVGEMSIDLRLGYNFLVTIHGSNPFIDASLKNKNQFPISSSFQETRRWLGETFLMHPNQTVLTSTLEYIKLPPNVYAELSMRSSYLRMGLSISAVVQPGYCGCFSMEFTNVNHVPINVTVGAPILQVRLHQLETATNYFSKPRKYVCQVRPVASAVNEDSDLQLLKRIWLQNNHLDEQG